jgi:hypothetical protein
MLNAQLFFLFNASQIQYLLNVQHPSGPPPLYRVISSTLGFDNQNILVYCCDYQNYLSNIVVAILVLLKWHIGGYFSSHACHQESNPDTMRLTAQDVLYHIQG